MIQILFNGLIAASVFALVGLGFSIIYKTTRFFNFVHAIIFTSGAYFTFLFKVWLNIPFLLSCLLAIISCLFLGCIINFLVYYALRNKKADSLVCLLTSLGIYIVLQNTISIIFGDHILSVRSGEIVEGYNFLGARVTFIQMLTFFISGGFIIFMACLFSRTEIGRTIRAVANNATLANIAGINSNQINLFSIAIGSALAGLAGVLVALDLDMTPTMGMSPLLMGIVAMIIGGINSIFGVTLGALLLAMAQHLGVWYIGSQWQDAIAFVILVMFLLFKPEGFFGKKIQSASV